MPVNATIDRDDTGTRILLQGELRYNQLMATLPGSGFKRQKNGWTMPLSWSSCLQIKNSFGADLIPSDELTEWLRDEYANRVYPAMLLRDATELPEGEGDPDLFPHQRAGVKFLATAKRALLADEPGLGKTAQAIRGLTELTRQGVTSFPALVVCPNTLKQNWKREIEKWWPGIRVHIIDGTPAQRKKQFAAFKGNPNRDECPIHGRKEAPGAILIETSTQTDSVEAATRKTSASGTPLTPSGSERTAITGPAQSEQQQTESTTSEPRSESLSKTMIGTSTMTQNVPSVRNQPQSSITTTTPEKSGASSVGPATTRSTKRRGTSTGSTELECTCPGHILVINWENLKLHSRLAPYGSIALKKCEEHGGADPKITPAKCEVHDKELNQIEFKAVIADEIHRAKNPKSAQTRALWAATGKADIRFGLTGTPQSGNVTDLWAIMHWVEETEWPSRSKWIDRTVVTQENAFGGMMILGLQPLRQQEFFDILNPRMRRMLKKVVLPFLPPILNQVRVVEMSPKQKKAYRDMEESMIAEVDGGHLLVKTPLTRAKRLQQFATAYAEMVEDGVNDQGEPKYRVKLSEPSSTAEAIANDIVEGDFGPQSIAVMAVSSQLLELISARLTKANIPHGMITGDYSLDVRQNAIDKFQAGHTKVILYTAQAGGVGVTLTAASVLLRAEIPYSLIDYLQGNDRVHRIGSEVHESILIVDYFAKDTVQYKTFEAIERKGMNFEEVVRDQDQLAKLLAEEKVVPW